jgi:hypothetical protein
MSDEQLEYWRTKTNSQDKFRPSAEVALEKKRLLDSRSLPARRDEGEKSEATRARGRQYFETAAWGGSDKPRAADPVSPKEPKGISDAVRGGAEYETGFGEFNMRPGRSGTIEEAQYEGFHREPPSWPSVGPLEAGNYNPIHIGHHPDQDYTPTSPLKEGWVTHLSGIHHTSDVKASMHALYRNSIKALPMMKHYYMLTTSLEEMQMNLRLKFEKQAHIRDPETIRHLLVLGWSEFNDMITFRKQRDNVYFFFGAQNKAHLRAQREWHEDKQRLLEDRLLFEGHYHGRLGDMHERSAEQRRLFDERLGRTPPSHVVSKGYFRVRVPDGTHAWERNQDLEGKHGIDVEPDPAIARQELFNEIDLCSFRPIHILQKERKRYRLQVAQIKRWAAGTGTEYYAEHRDAIFNAACKAENSHEMNRVPAEGAVARMDDDVLTRQDGGEAHRINRQLHTEFPHPAQRLSEGYVLRKQQAIGQWFEYNWAKGPSGGAALTAAENAWLSDPVNHAIRHSDAFAAMWKDKARNPMARTWADFYAAFDPDEAATRRLPWVHPDFDYDRRYKWDERCMRAKKWLRGGGIDATRPFLDSVVAEWVQRCGSVERSVGLERAAGDKFRAPAMVQRYRALRRRVDIALANQMREFLGARLGGPPAAESDAKAVAAALAVVEAADWAAFRFVVPVLVYPDGVDGPADVAVDGRVAAVATA